MRCLFFLIITALICHGCNSLMTHISSFEEFEFSYTNTFGDSYTIKFTEGDTVYVARYFPYPYSNFIGVIPSYERKKIDSLISLINFNKLDTMYYQDYEDGVGYQFYVKNDSLAKTILVHSDIVPNNLKQVANWIVNAKRNWRLLPIDSIFEMKNIDFFKPPIPPVPSTNH